jgi:hypothetical protein
MHIIDIPSKIIECQNSSNKLKHLILYLESTQLIALMSYSLLLIKLGYAPILAKKMLSAKKIYSHLEAPM